MSEVLLNIHAFSDPVYVQLHIARPADWQHTPCQLTPNQLTKPSSSTYNIHFANLQHTPWTISPSPSLSSPPPPLPPPHFDLQPPPLPHHPPPPPHFSPLLFPHLLQHSQRARQQVEPMAGNRVQNVRGVEPPLAPRPLAERQLLLAGGGVGCRVKGLGCRDESVGYKGQGVRVRV